MADKKLNNVSTLTSSTLASSDYAYVEDVSASNEQKKVLISDLAKVVGGQGWTTVAKTAGSFSVTGTGIVVAVKHSGGTCYWIDLYIISNATQTKFANAGNSGITFSYSDGVTTFDVSNIIGSSCLYKVIA